MNIHFISSSNPFYIEQKSNLYRAFNLHPFFPQTDQYILRLNSVLCYFSIPIAFEMVLFYLVLVLLRKLVMFRRALMYIYRLSFINSVSLSLSLSFLDDRISIKALPVKREKTKLNEKPILLSDATIFQRKRFLFVCLKKQYLPPSKNICFSVQWTTFQYARMGRFNIERFSL